MALLTRQFAGLSLVLLLAITAGCGGGSLTTAATDIIDTQREANLTRDRLTGLWEGEVRSTDGVGSQTVLLKFAQGEGFNLDGSFLVGSDISIGTAVARDTFSLVNGVFKAGDIRFNLALSGSSLVIVSEGEPVLFTGLLSEDDYMSGRMKAGSRTLGYWEAVISDTTAEAETPVEAETL